LLLITEGFYNLDKKDGFGIYIWNEQRAYIGFWKEGRQHGTGKYINDGVVKYGQWLKGKRTKWYDTESEALDTIPEQEMVFSKLFIYELQEIAAYYNF
jgi:hypothetical protein